jgi:hypothetical protein
MPPTILVIQHKETVTLLKGRRAPVTDITLLGKFNGWEVARATRDVDPDLSVVYMSVSLLMNGPPNVLLIILPQPFAPEQLTTAASQLVNARLAAGSDKA